MRAPYPSVSRELPGFKPHTLLNEECRCLAAGIGIPAVIANFLRSNAHQGCFSRTRSASNANEHYLVFHQNYSFYDEAIRTTQIIVQKIRKSKS